MDILELGKNKIKSLVGFGNMAKLKVFHLKIIFLGIVLIRKWNQWF